MGLPLRDRAAAMIHLMARDLRRRSVSGTGTWYTLAPLRTGEIPNVGITLSNALRNTSTAAQHEQNEIARRDQTTNTALRGSLQQMLGTWQQQQQQWGRARKP